MIRVTGIVAGVLALSVLAGCNRERPLPGERLDLRAPLNGEVVEDAPATVAAPFAAPPTVVTQSWTHRAGSVTHNVAHPAFSANPQLLWSARIGAGDSRRHRITADPVVADGRIFTMDSRATVTAVSTAGAVLWSRDLTPDSEREGESTSGGLATDGARVYATSGFGRLTALDAATGAELWTQRLGAAATSAPTVSDGVVYAVGLDSRGWAINAETGRVIWEVAGTPSPAGILAGASPAVTDRLVLLPFTSGELVAVLKLSGLRVWTAPLTGQRAGRVYARINDVSGDPVIVGDKIHTGTPAGRSMQLDLASGERIWTAPEGAMSPTWVSGNSVFQISDQNELLRLDAATGKRVWGVQLPYFTNERVRRRRAIYDHYGPVLAGGRIVVLSGDGEMRLFNPDTGGALGSVPIPGGAASLPAIVGGTMYLVSGSGQLHAFR